MQVPHNSVTLVHINSAISNCWHFSYRIYFLELFVLKLLAGVKTLYLFELIWDPIILTEYFHSSCRLTHNMRVEGHSRHII